ncbi:HlyD family secretion protein [Roseateles depolymerans]|uniref:Hemolysin secretion protein D n=1 Tax=Roseateles depolymerans TaxID=76731 RepID=A0A0U3LLP3_9BURK|nr:HlyD family secretion protein [Roseateles depolymerans]ALV07346.1 hemolysin secretion protein D [Roseateles depolymerans]REG22444.1 multidrug resistance efflux pump [Roseateles depolymerans]
MIPARTFVLVTVPALLGVLAVLYAWELPPFRSDVQTTEDAYVRGSITIIAPKVDGYVAQVLVKDFEDVRAGQLLVKLDDGNYAQKLEQAKATLAAQEANLANFIQSRRAKEATLLGSEAAVAMAQAQRVNSEAQLERAWADEHRVNALVADGSLSIRERDQTHGLLRQAEATQKQAKAAQLQAAANRALARQDLQAVIVNRRVIEANVASARAAVKLAEIDLEHTNIRAPQAGRVGEVGVKLGQYATPGSQMMALVPSRLWVIANYKEAQTAHMSPGQPASVRVDALGDKVLRGHVESLAPATGSEFSVIRADNATGNFTKIPQRVPVRIVLELAKEDADRLRPGLSVVASVDTRKAGS